MTSSSALDPQTAGVVGSSCLLKVQSLCQCLSILHLSTIIITQILHIRSTTAVDDSIAFCHHVLGVIDALCCPFTFSLDGHAQERKDGHQLLDGNMIVRCQQFCNVRSESNKSTVEHKVSCRFE